MHRRRFLADASLLLVTALQPVPMRREPLRIIAEQQWFVWELRPDGATDEPHLLPRRVFHCLNGYWIDEGHPEYRCYLTEKSAMEAMRQAERK